MLCPNKAREESNKDRRGRENKVCHQSIDPMLVLVWVVWSWDCKTKKSREKKEKEPGGATGFLL